MWPTSNLGNLLVRIPLVMLSAIFVAEAVIMAVLILVPAGSQNRWLEIVVDSTVLTLTVAPLFYWLIVKPLRAVAAERARLLAHLFEIQDAERQRFARDLHDEIGQSFTSLLVQMRLLEDASTLDSRARWARSSSSPCTTIPRICGRRLGVRISDSTAARLLPGIKITFDGAAMGKVHYRKALDLFSATLKVGKQAKGMHEIGIHLTVDGSEVTTLKIPLKVI